MDSLAQWMGRLAQMARNRAAGRCPRATRRRPPRFTAGAGALEARCLLSMDALLQLSALMSLESAPGAAASVNLASQGLSTAGFRTQDGTGNNLANPTWGS